jgi:hypothetical protein
MSNVQQAIKALEHAQDIDSFYPGGDRLGVRQCIDKALEMLREEQPSIPEGFTAYDGEGQPVGDDVVVRWFSSACDENFPPVLAGDVEWDDGAYKIDAYKVIHDPSRLPEVPWEDYPEAARATLDGDGILTLWRDGFDLSLRQRVLARFPGFDMTHLDPARCKWERPAQPASLEPYEIYPSEMAKKVKELDGRLRALEAWDKTRKAK